MKGCSTTGFFVKRRTTPPFQNISAFDRILASLTATQSRNYKNMKFAQVRATTVRIGLYYRDNRQKFSICHNHTDFLALVKTG
jgi:hypothetical protein